MPNTTHIFRPLKLRLSIDSMLRQGVDKDTILSLSTRLFSHGERRVRVTESFDFDPNENPASRMAEETIFEMVEAFLAPKIHRLRRNEPYMKVVVERWRRPYLFGLFGHKRWVPKPSTRTITKNLCWVEEIVKRYKEQGVPCLMESPAFLKWQKSQIPVKFGF